MKCQRGTDDLRSLSFGTSGVFPLQKLESRSTADLFLNRYYS